MSYRRTTNEQSITIDKNEIALNAWSETQVTHINDTDVNRIIGYLQRIARISARFNNYTSYDYRIDSHRCFPYSSDHDTLKKLLFPDHNHYHKSEDYALVNDEGKIVKRISKRIKERYNFNLSDVHLARLGNIIYETNNAKTLDIRISNDFSFGHTDNVFYGDKLACFHHANIPCKTSLFEVGAYVVQIRKHSETEETARGEGIARAWMMLEDESAILFNAYGLSLEAIGAIMSRSYCLPTIKTVTLGYHAPSTFYTNEGYALAVGSYADSSYEIRIRNMIGECSCCHEYTELTDNDSGWTCSDCDGSYFTCYSCEERFPDDDANCVHGECYCQSCYDERFTTCDCCGESMYDDDIQYVDSTEESVCEYCYDHRYQTCEHCESMFASRGNQTTDLCDDCVLDYRLVVRCSRSLLSPFRNADFGIMPAFRVIRKRKHSTLRPFIMRFEFALRNPFNRLSSGASRSIMTERAIIVGSRMYYDPYGACHFRRSINTCYWLAKVR